MGSICKQKVFKPQTPYMAEDSIQVPHAAQAQAQSQAQLGTPEPHSRPLPQTLVRDTSRALHLALPRNKAKVGKKEAEGSGPAKLVRQAGRQAISPSTVSHTASIKRLLAHIHVHNVSLRNQWQQGRRTCKGME